MADEPTILKQYPELIRILRIEPPRGPSRLLPYVLPVAIVENLPSLEIPTTIIGNGLYSAGPVAGAAATLLLDTGQLPAGTYEGELYCTVDASQLMVEFQHRDAANAATLDFIRFRLGQWVGGAQGIELEGSHFSVALAEDERLRFFMISITAALNAWATIVLRKTG